MSEKIYKTGDSITTPKGGYTVVKVGLDYALINSDHVAEFMHRALGQDGIHEDVIKKWFPQTYSVGQRFVFRANQRNPLNVRELILIQSGVRGVNLLIVGGACSWETWRWIPTSVADPKNITQEEFSRICGGVPQYFELVVE